MPSSTVCITSVYTTVHIHASSADVSIQHSHGHVWHVFADTFTNVLQIICTNTWYLKTQIGKSSSNKKLFSHDLELCSISCRNIIQTSSYHSAFLNWRCIIGQGTYRVPFNSSPEFKNNHFGISWISMISAFTAHNISGHLSRNCGIHFKVVCNCFACRRLANTLLVM